MIITTITIITGMFMSIAVTLEPWIWAFWNQLFLVLQWLTSEYVYAPHNDVIKWKLFPRYWPFVRGIHRSPVNSPHKGQWRGALMFSLICVWINDWVNNGEAGDFRRYRIHYDVTVMWTFFYNIELSGLPSDSFKSNLYSQLGYSTGYFQTLYIPPLVCFVFAAMDWTLASCMLVHFLNI